jgi:hypothetical protein
MRKKNLSPYYLPLIISLIGWFSVYSQPSNLYMPLEFQKAYKNGTRSFDGFAGPNYWQNWAEYNMEVELLPNLSLITGSGEIIYHNDSVDSLETLIFRLYQDIYRRGNSRQFKLESKTLNEGTKIHYLKINDVGYQLEGEGSSIKRRATNLFVNLIDPLLPGGNLRIEVGWSFEIPKERPIRMGQYADNRFFIAYWYPQIAVYDDIDGWDTVEYEGMVEFYNDFNDYQVSITVPGDFSVWATGELQNMEDVFDQKIVKQFRKAQKSEQVVHIITAEDYKNGAVTRRNKKNVWKFSATHVPDFSFGTSNHYLWDAASLVVDKDTRRRVLTAVVYPDSAAHYEEGAFISRETIKYLSEKCPGVPYPYPHVTTFCNGTKGGGMETPMMANNGAPGRRANAVELIFHEISHNYFPFYMGTNERKYAWMDEGWATFFPREVVEKLEPDTDYLEKRIENYQTDAGKENELELMIPSYTATRGLYRTAAYERPAVAYFMLQDLLGDELFKKTLQEYIYRWNGKHPTPYDFFFTFENFTGKKLDWFWKPWFFEQGFPDLAIKQVKSFQNELTVSIEKVGNIPVPVNLCFLLEDNSEKVVYKSVNIWDSGKNEIEIRFNSDKMVKKIILGNDHIPDINTSNNNYVLITDTNKILSE